VHSDATVPDQLEHVFQRACAELHRRLEAGQTAPAESVLRDFTSLSESDHRAVSLIEREWQLRKDRGEALDVASFCQRFPRWEAQLRRRLRASDSSDEQQAETTVAEHKQPDGSVAVEATEALTEHDIHERLGRGGMGEVYRAYDRILKRFVAIKMIRADLLPNNDDVKRFYREAQTAAQLAHPHIIMVHRMGLHRGEHSFTMGLAGGGSLVKRLAEFREPRKAVELLVKIVDAVAHAHEEGIIHRDLKPANILFDERDEPLVSDFGLAKAIAGSGELTLSGQVLGTPAYMSPEQASGRIYHVGPHSDVWSLGVILYELLTGRKPFQGDGSSAILQAVIAGEYPAPETIQTDLDPALAKLIRLCLTYDWEQRSLTARELRDALKGWLVGEVLPDLPQRVAPKRRPRMMVLGAGLCVATIGMLAAIGWGMRDRPKDTTPSEPVVEKPQPIPIAFPRDVTYGRGTMEHLPDGSVRLKSDEKTPEWVWVVLADPQQLRRYRFSIDVEDVDENSEDVGIFWDLHEATKNDVHNWWCVAWTYRERKTEEAGLRGLRVTGWLHFEFIWDSLNPPFHSVSAPERGEFAPRQGSKRHMVLEVTPRGADYFWDNNRQPVKTYHRATWDENWTKLFRLKPALAPKAPEVPGSGKIGIMCWNGAAIFSNPTLEPLPGEE